MILILKGANFSEHNIGTLDSWFIAKSIGSGATVTSVKVAGASVGTTIPGSIKKNSALEIILTVADGIEFTASDIVVTMSGSSITPSISGKTITISIASVTNHVDIKVNIGAISGGGSEEDSGTETVTLVFTEGTLDSTTGAEKAATGTYRSDYVAVDASSVIKFTSAKTMIVFKYDSSKTYTSRDKTDWYSASEVSVSDAAYVRVLVKGASAPPTDGTVTRTSSSGGNNGGGSGGSEDLGNTTFGSSETPVTIISDFSGFTFENGKVVSTSAGSTCDFSTGTARAASTTQVLKVSGGETYTFTPTISGLQYALIEFTDAPCTKNTLNKSGQYGQAWSSVASGTIHTNTKYLTINFNRGSGNFTASELEALKNAIKLS